MEERDGGISVGNSRIALLEAALFMASRPLSIEELSSIVGVSGNEIESMLEEIEREFADGRHGIFLDRSGGYRLMVKPEYLERVRNLSPYADLSRGLLRALAIVAYNEPVKQSDIVKLIGNRAYEYIRELEIRGLVRTEKASRTKVVTTTENFEKYFGVSREKLREMLGREDGVMENGEAEADDSV